MKKIAIIGAGLSGLVTAWFLKTNNSSLDVTVFESDKKGGVVSTENIEGINIETGPAFFVLENPLMQQISSAISGTSLIRVKDDKVHVLKDSYYQKAPSGFMEFENGLYSFLSGGFMSMLGLKKKISVWDNLSFFDFIKSTYGQTYAESLGSTFSRAMFFCEAEDLNLQAAYPELYNNLKQGLNLKEAVLATSKQNSDFWKSELGESQWSKFTPGIYYHKDGLGNFINLLYDDLKSKGVHFEFARVSEISAHKNEYSLHSRNNKLGIFSNAILTSSAEDQSGMIKALSKDFSTALGELKYRPVSFVYSAYPMKVFNRSGLGFFGSRKEKLTISGSYFVNAYSSEPEQKGMFLTRTVIAGDLSLFNNDELINLQRNDFDKVFGLTAEPSWAKVYRHDKAIPSLDKTYHEWKNKVMTMSSEFPGIKLSGKDFSSGNLNSLLKDAYLTAKSLC
jgi:oxygen-dependent protoporphyrinogen oxidase